MGPSKNNQAVLPRAHATQDYGVETPDQALRRSCLKFLESQKHVLGRLSHLHHHPPGANGTE